MSAATERQRRRRSDVDTWCMDVQFALIGPSLEHFLGDKLVKPAQFDDRSRGRKHKSKDYARKFCKEIQGNEQSSNVITTLFRHDKLERMDVVSPAEFITESEKVAITCFRMKVFISPTCALVKVKQQIEWEFDKFRFLNEKVDQLEPDEITDEDFHAYLKPCRQRQEADIPCRTHRLERPKE
ncbi:hypothetical protein N7475_003421 [Penicillium sp. IBT 31633x]|nr:hypothetical protein N7475_003421 [Penicillium sp. IBT 31633x]